MTEIFLYALSDKFLFTEELIPDIIKRTTVPVLTVLRYGEYLIIPFDCQFKVVFKIVFDELEDLMKNLFALGEKRNVISVLNTGDVRSFFSGSKPV